MRFTTVPTAPEKQMNCVDRSEVVPHLTLTFDIIHKIKYLSLFKDQRSLISLSLRMIVWNSENVSE